MSVHPLRAVWRAFVTSPASSTDQAVFVEGSTYQDARERICTVARLLHGEHPEWSEDECFYNLHSFDELVEMGHSASRTQRLFETGWCGTEVICWSRAAVFVVRRQKAVALADAYAHLPRTGGVFVPAAWQRMTRAKSMAHPDKGGEVADFYAPLERVAALFGKPDATLFDNRGPNWSLSWPDGLVARVYNWHRRKGGGVWHIASDDERAVGRVACIVADAVATVVTDHGA